MTRRIGVITVPGDRRDEDAREVGRIAGTHLDHVIVKEDGDLRGRRPGEISRLLTEGLLQGGLARERIETIFSEPAAMQRGLELLHDGELLVLLVDKVREVLHRLESHGDMPA